MINPAILQQLKTTGEQLFEHLDADARDIFSTMVGVELPKSERVETGTRFKGSLTAMVGFAGSYTGMISITTPQKLAQLFASQMLGTEVADGDEDVRDALGELANMIGGSFKHHFINDGHEVRLSTPSVMSGEDYCMNSGAVPDTLTLRFPCEAEEFQVSVYLEAG